MKYIKNKKKKNQKLFVLYHNIKAIVFYENRLLIAQTNVKY